MADLLYKKDSALDKIRIYSGGLIIFYMSLAAFSITLAAQGGLSLFNNSQKKAQDQLLEQIKLKEDELEPTLLNQIFSLDAQLKNIRSILVQHQFPSNVFEWLEANTHPQVRFANFNFVTASRKLNMSGEALSFAVLSRQITIFENNPQVEFVEFGGLSVGGNNMANFKLTVVFKNDLLKTSPE